MQRVPDMVCHDTETARTITHSLSTWHDHVIVVSEAKPGTKENGDDRPVYICSLDLTLRVA